MQPPNFLIPDWPAPTNVKAYTTLRMRLGVSQAPYQQFNLAAHVGDSLANVQQNRLLLKQHLALPAEPTWIKQTHSQIALSAESFNLDQEADATYAQQPNQVCIILTADCLPILICDRAGNQVAAIHAGWRGILSGIIENTLKKLTAKPEELLVWLGPAISQSNYEVGDEMRDLFLQDNPTSEVAFIPSTSNKRWLASLNELARLRLQAQGVASIYGGDHCTFADSKRFFSYRRDGQQTGRIASLIWIM
jgi:YfiH family protein